tara:strand:- start:4785 stop:5285 length:501 start_codon:yes stop_codon:yes gene_type:complete
MYLRISQHTSIDSNSIAGFSFEGKILYIIRNNNDKPLDIIYDTEEECNTIFNNLNNHFKSKDLMIVKTNNIEINKEKEIKLVMFKAFWTLYNKKTGMQKCQDKFLKYGLNTMQIILDAVPTYIKETPDPKFRKHPLTWLNGEYWKDEKMKEEEKTKLEFNVNDLFK